MNKAANPILDGFAAAGKVQGIGSSRYANSAKAHPKRSPDFLRQHFSGAFFTMPYLHAADLEAAASYWYRHFVGDNYQRFGAAARSAPWAQVYERRAGVPQDIVAELRALSDPAIATLVAMLLDAGGSTETTRQMLSAVYDDPSVSQLTIYQIGAGVASTGIVLAGLRTNGEATFLLFLMD